MKVLGCACGAIGLIAAAAADASSIARHRALAFVDVAVFDGTGSPLREHQTVLVRDGRISAVGSARLRVPGDYRIINGRGLTLLPGLWDMHVHTLWDADVPKAFLPEFISYGVTSVRDMGGNEEGWDAAKAFSNAYPHMSPDIYRAGRVLDGPVPVHPGISIAISTPAEARSAIVRAKGDGVDFIKVYTLLSRDAFLAASDEAKKAGLPLAGHLPNGVTVADAVSVRMLTIEHLASEVGGYCPRSEPARCEAAFEAIVGAGIAQTPTLVARRNRAEAADHPEWMDKPSLQRLPPVAISEWKNFLSEKLSASPVRTASRKADFQHELWMAGQVYKHGAQMLVGSDTGTPFVYPGEGLHEEMALLVSVGMSPSAVLSAATFGAAKSMGRASRTGRVARGFRADLLVVQGDPTVDITATRHIAYVVRAGALIEAPALN